LAASLRYLAQCREIATAYTFGADFGLSTECGFGRRRPETISELLKLHAAL
jgi:hypothetical protein